MAYGREIKNLFAPTLVCLAAALAMAVADADQAASLLRSARAWVGLPCHYDGSYREIGYPGGDPGGKVGVCSDLVVRAYRGIGVDLQVLVHEDMKKDFKAYPALELYSQTKPDPNIDHRRVPNLTVFLNRHGQTLPAGIGGKDLDSWKGGDLVVFDLLENGLPTHIGIVSDKKGESGRPLVIHHFPPLPSEDDCLANWKIIGHYRYFPAPPAPKPEPKNPFDPSEK